MSITQRMQHVNYRLFIYFLPVPIFMFYTLPLTGCISQSPGVRNIFLVKLQSNDDVTLPSSEIRLGYFGICTLVEGELTCQPSSGKDTNAMLQPASATSPFNETNFHHSASMVSLALTLQSKFIPALIAGAGVLFTLSLFFVILLKRDFKTVGKGNGTAARRKHFLRHAVLTTLWLSVAFSLSAATSVHQTTNAIAYVAQPDGSSVRITAGSTLNVLQWLAFAFSVFFAAGISVMFTREGGMIRSIGLTEPTIHSNFLHTSTPPPPPPPPPPQ